MLGETYQAHVAERKTDAQRGGLTQAWNLGSWGRGYDGTFFLFEKMGNGATYPGSVTWGK